MTCTVSVCRDCCCGTTRKHPGVDHDAQLDRLREGVTGRGRVVVSQCLLVCERSNVVVVSPSPDGRRAGARPVWLGELLSEEHVEAVIAWVRVGGPGAAPMPLVLDGLVTPRPGLVDYLPATVR